LNLFTILFAAFLVLMIAWAVYRSTVKKSGLEIPDVFPEKWRNFLEKEVHFYTSLNQIERSDFEEDISKFLKRVKITGVKTSIDDEDRLLVASSAVIPIFRFSEWEYSSLWEVLLYPDLFKEDFDLEGNDRYTSGMVGSSGSMNHVVIFSKPALRLGFDNKSDKSNVGIHEFVHLFDKEDGTIDGIPSIIMKNQSVIPWLNLIKKNTAEMLEGKSDINVYGATNHQEFLAVVSEYFFERPSLLKEKHPELYDILAKVFQTDLAENQ
jgi:hypothetical protein